MSNLKNKDKKGINKLDITKFTFLRDFMLVKALRPDTDSDDLIDPAQYEDKPEFGEVICVGESVAKITVGSIIRFGKYSSELIRNNKNDYFIIREEDVSAIQ